MYNSTFSNILFNLIPSTVQMNSHIFVLSFEINYRLHLWQEPEEVSLRSEHSRNLPFLSHF